LSQDAHIEPYYTLRYHVGPVFALSGTQDPRSNANNIVFTGGSEGVIRAWNLPHPDRLGSYKACNELDFCTGLWNAHVDVIWELQTHLTQVTFLKRE